MYITAHVVLYAFRFMNHLPTYCSASLMFVVNRVPNCRAVIPEPNLWIHEEIGIFFECTCPL